jgi:hypothetical protein
MRIPFDLQRNTRGFVPDEATKPEARCQTMDEGTEPNTLNDPADMDRTALHDSSPVRTADRSAESIHSMIRRDNNVNQLSQGFRRISKSLPDGHDPLERFREVLSRMVVARTDGPIVGCIPHQAQHSQNSVAERGQSVCQAHPNARQAILVPPAFSDIKSFFYIAEVRLSAECFSMQAFAAAGRPIALRRDRRWTGREFGRTRRVSVPSG